MDFSKGLQEICCEDFWQIWSHEVFADFLLCCGLQESDCFPKGALDAEWAKTDTGAAAGTRCLSESLYIKDMDLNLEKVRLGIVGTIGTLGEYIVWSKIISTAHSCRPSDLLFSRKDRHEPLWKRTEDGTGWVLTVSGEDHAHRLAKLVGMEVADGKKDCPTVLMAKFQSLREKDNEELLNACLQRTRKTLLGLTAQANPDCFSRFTTFKNFTFASNEDSRLLTVTIPVSPSVMSLFVPMGCSTFGDDLNIAQRLILQPDGINSRKIVGGGDDRMIAGGKGILFSAFGETRESYNFHQNDYCAMPLLADTNPVPPAEAAIEMSTRPMACPIPAVTSGVNKEGELRRVYPREPTRDNMLRLASQMIATTGDDIEAAREYLEGYLGSMVKEMGARGKIPAAEDATMQLRARLVCTLEIIWLWSIMMQWVQNRFHGLQSPEDWSKLLSWVSSKFYRVSYETLMARGLPIRQTCVTRLTRTLFRAAFDEPALAFLDGQARIAAVSCAVMNRAPSSDVNELVEKVNVDAEAKMNRRLHCKSCGTEAQLKLVFQLSQPGKLFDEGKRVSMHSFSTYVQQVASSAAKISLLDYTYGLLEDIARNPKQFIPPELSQITGEDSEEENNLWLAKQRLWVAEQLEAGRGVCPDLNLLIVSYYTENKGDEKTGGGANSRAWIELFDELENHKTVKKAKQNSADGSEKVAAMVRRNNNFGISFNSGLPFLVSYIAQSCWATNGNDRRAIDTAKSFVNYGGSRPAAVPTTDSAGSDLQINDLLTYGYAEKHLTIREEEQAELDDEESKERETSKRQKVVQYGKAFFFDQTCDEFFTSKPFMKRWLSCLSSQPAKAEAKRFIEILPKLELGNPAVMLTCSQRFQLLVYEPSVALASSIFFHFQEGSANNARKNKLFIKVLLATSRSVLELYNRFGTIIPIPKILSERMPYLFCILTADFFGSDAVSAQVKKRKDARVPHNIDRCYSNIPAYIYALVYMINVRQIGDDGPKPMIQLLEKDEWRQLGKIDAKMHLIRRSSRATNMEEDDPVDWHDVWEPNFCVNGEYFDTILPCQRTNLREVCALIFDGRNVVKMNKIASVYDKKVLTKFRMASICNMNLEVNFKKWNDSVNQIERKKTGKWNEANEIVKKKKGNGGRKRMSAGEDAGLAEQVRGGPPSSSANAPPTPEEHNDNNGCDDYQEDGTRLEFETDDDKKDSPAAQLNPLHDGQVSVGGKEEEPYIEHCQQEITGHDGFAPDQIGREKVELICGKLVDTYLSSKMSDHGNDEAGKKHRHEHIMRRLEELLPNTLKSLIEHIDGDGEGDRDGDADADGDGNGNGNGDDFNYVDQGDYVGGADNIGGDCKDNRQAHDTSHNSTSDDTNGSDNEPDGRNYIKDGDQAEFITGANGHDGTSLPCQADGRSVLDEETSMGDDDEWALPDIFNPEMFGKHLALMSSSRSVGREDDRAIGHGIRADHTGTDNVSGNAVVDSDLNSVECVEAMSQFTAAPIASDDDAESGGSSKAKDVEVAANHSVAADRSARSGVFSPADTGGSKLSKEEGREERHSAVGGLSSGGLLPNRLSGRHQDLESGAAKTRLLSNAAPATAHFTLSSRNKKPSDGRRSLEEPLQVALTQQQLGKPAKLTGLYKDWADGREGKVQPDLSTGGAAAAGNKKSSSQTGKKRAKKGTQTRGQSSTQKGTEAGEKRKSLYASETMVLEDTKADAKTRPRTAPPGSIKPSAIKTGGARNDPIPTNSEAAYYSSQFSPGKLTQVREDGIPIQPSASRTKECKQSSDDERKAKQQRIARQRHPLVRSAQGRLSQRLDVVKPAEGNSGAAVAARLLESSNQESQTEEEEAVRATKKIKKIHRTLRQPSFDSP